MCGDCEYGAINLRARPRGAQIIVTPIRVALIEGVVPSYRLPFLELLKEEPDVEITCFHGPGKAGHSVDSVGMSLPVKSIAIRNFFWPIPGERIALQSGLWCFIRGHYDVVVCAEHVHNLSTWAILFLSKISRYGVVLTGHGPYRKPNTGWTETLRLRLRRVLAHLADNVLVYTEVGANRLRKIGMPEERIFVSGNTLDTRRLIRIAESVRSETKTAIAASSRPFTLIYVGRLYPEKRIDLLIETARVLVRRGVEADFLIVGDGRQRNELEALAHDLPNVRFLGAEYDLYRLAELFESADILFVPTYVGLIVVHGFCHSLPILTSAEGLTDTPEFDYIEHDGNGVLVSSLSAEAFADEIERLKNNPDLRRRLAEGALATARRLDMQSMVEQFVAAVRHANKCSGGYRGGQTGNTIR